MNFEQDIVNSLEALRNGGTILYPTDTIWGIGCDATDAAAVAKVFKLKDRDEKKSLVILLADVRDLLKYVAHTPPDIADIIAGFDRPTTVIYQGALGLADNVINEDGSVAIRIVKEDFCRHLVKRLRKPLVSTSANISGEPSPANFSAVSPRIINGVDYAVLYRREEAAAAQASRIVRLLPSGEMEVIRP
ncbi:Sua5/YciO/YrdC/YwlC family protein [Chitinophaga horti]|uniref:L-threonylcarbamoyladenylate synthase n=1 Tax=Chitinophaga horti TaxID=2920382 RepID=A0ABY6IUZ9_9BACT|nr:L-threonylcarbamoyladenylate synthase [Chitinophaga horti]UYQ91120.1 Sua5/YciO/YrdC/YwlC family protein [Chitinophaga horti]